MLSSKLLRIGRLAEFAVGSICSGNSGIETIHPTGARVGPMSFVLRVSHAPGTGPIGPMGSSTPQNSFY
jgi:hypothetical protein